MKHIRLSGSPLEKGLMHGEHYKKEIRELAGLRMALLRQYLFDTSRMEAIVDKQLAVLAHHADLHAEFCGIARAAGCSLLELAVLNNYTDLRDFAPTDEGCSLFGVLDQGVLLCGQTWDMHASARPYALHIELEDPVRTHVLSLTGCLGMAGVGARGVAVLINNLWSDETAAGLMWPALVRELLLQPTAATAGDYLIQHMPSSGRNYLLCGPDGACNIECTGRRHAQTFGGTAGLVLHTNHYLSGLAATQKPLKKDSTSLQRLQDLQTYFAAGGRHDLQSLSRDILAGEKVKTVNIPQPAHPDMPMTCGGLILDMPARRGRAFAGNYGEGDWRDISW